MRQIFIFFSLIIFSSSFSQDMIYKSDGSAIPAKIVSVDKEEVKYKKFANPDGPTYIIYISKIDKIIYENGYEEFFGVESEEEPEQENNGVKNYTDFDFTKYNSAFQFRIFDIVYNEFTISYEYLTANRKLGIEIPLSLGFNISEPIFRDASVFYSGVKLNVYPAGLRRFTYFTGPEIRIGETATSDYNGNTNDYEIDNYMIYGKFMVNNGVIYNVAENFFISSHLGVGVRYYTEDVDYNTLKGMHNTVTFTISMAIRF
jgi:hypothetical protein